jgi:arylsulfatase A-like enzyme
VAVSAAEQIRDHLRSGDGRPFFLYAHFIDLHTPTNPKPPYDSLYPTIDGGPHEKRHFWWQYDRGEGLDTEAFRAYRSHKLALYDGALRLIDDEIKNLFGFLEREGLDSSTIVLVASDHGEEFWDHLEFEKRVHLDPRQITGVGHGHSMFNELLRVPLIIQGPDVPVGRITQQVRNLDIMPTVLSLAGIDPGGRDLRGIDLIAPIRAGELTSQVAFSEDMAYGFEAKALQDERFKLIRFARTRLDQTDFLIEKSGRDTEVRESDAQASDAARRLRTQLEGTLESRRVRQGRSVTLDEEAQERLRALGYLP